MKQIDQCHADPHWSDNYITHALEKVGMLLWNNYSFCYLYIVSNLSKYTADGVIIA